MVDRAYRFFDGLRSSLVLRSASSEFYAVYNDLTFDCQDVYRAGTPKFQAGLLPFEEQALSDHFPSPPGTVLVGAAGGGREALILSRRGYQVVAFEPAPALVASLAQAGNQLPIEPLLGRYEELPLMRSLTRPPITVDLRSRAPFQAAILGWSSFSHLRSDADRIDTLRHFGSLTHGPILVSYYPTSPSGSCCRFSVAVGYHRSFSGDEIRGLVQCAGLEVIYLDEDDNWPHAVLRAPQRASSIS